MTWFIIFCHFFLSAVSFFILIPLVSLFFFFLPSNIGFVSHPPFVPHLSYSSSIISVMLVSLQIFFLVSFALSSCLQLSWLQRLFSEYFFPTLHYMKIQISLAKRIGLVIFLFLDFLMLAYYRKLLFRNLGIYFQS